MGTKTVAVVGGSGGLGEHICLKLASEDTAILVGFFSGQDKADDLVARIRPRHGQWIFVMPLR